MAAEGTSVTGCCCLQKFQDTFEQFTKIYTENRRLDVDIQKQFMETMMLKMVESVTISQKQTEILTEMIELMKSNNGKNQTTINRAKFVQIGKSNNIRNYQPQHEDGIGSGSGDSSSSVNSEIVKEYETKFSQYYNGEHGYNDLDLTSFVSTESSFSESEYGNVGSKVNSKLIPQEEGALGSNDLYSNNIEIPNESDPKIEVYNPDSGIAEDYQCRSDVPDNLQLPDSNYKEGSIYSYAGDVLYEDMYENTINFQRLPSLKGKKRKLPKPPKKLVNRILRYFVCSMGSENHIYDEVTVPKSRDRDHLESRMADSFNVVTYE